MSEFKELQEWYEKHKHSVLVGKTIHEIGTLATACGFDRQTVAQWEVMMTFKAA